MNNEQNVATSQNLDNPWSSYFQQRTDRTQQEMRWEPGLLEQTFDRDQVHTHEQILNLAATDPDGIPPLHWNYDPLPEENESRAMACKRAMQMHSENSAVQRKMDENLT